MPHESLPMNNVPCNRHFVAKSNQLELIGHGTAQKNHKPHYTGNRTRTRCGGRGQRVRLRGWSREREQERETRGEERQPIYLPLNF